MGPIFMLEAQSLLICLILSVHGDDVFKIFSVADLSGHDQLTQVAVDQNTNIVYVGGKNAIYQLTPELNVTSSSSTNQYKDNQLCKPYPSQCQFQRVNVNNIVQILEINPVKKYLLACGSVYQGLCTLHSLRDVKNKKLFNSGNIINYVGSSNGAVAIFGNLPESLPADVQDGDKVLYTAASYDNRPLELMPPSVSSRNISYGNPDELSNMSYLFKQRAVHTYIDVDRDYKKNYPIHYVYAFEDDGFTYFVSVQRESIQPSYPYETHLIRVCQNDAAYYSYTEIPITCGSNHTGTYETYNVAQAAYYGVPGEKLEKNLNTNGKLLYVTFAKSRPSFVEPEKKYGSAVCAFSLEDIRTAFKEAQEDCYAGIGKYMKWIFPQEIPCQVSTKVVDEDFCGSQHNVAIGTDIPIEGEAIHFAKQDIYTAIAVTTYTSDDGGESDTIGILGTQSGDLVKVLLNGSPQTPYMNISVSGDRSVRVERDMEFDPGKEHLYVITGAKLTRFPVHSCRVYNECSMCVPGKRVPDPLKCGWCSGQCTTKQDCLKPHWTDKTCPPVLYDFTPASGPVQGGTKVTIHGRDFGSIDMDSEQEASGVTVNVHVALKTCTILSKTSRKIVCTTASASKETAGEVEVEVVDRSTETEEKYGYHIEGTAKSRNLKKDTFSYKDVLLSDFSPNFGPRSGGTNITVEGQNLDIGSSVNITVATIPCSLQSVEPSEIVCTTQAWTADDSQFSRKKRELGHGNLKMNIDGAELTIDGKTFVYKHDPVITDIFPRKSTVSGGLPVTIVGRNLHVVASPRIGAMVRITEKSTPTELCEYNHNGTMMTCPALNITGVLPGQEPTASSPLAVDIFFIMDGVTSLRKFSASMPKLSLFEYYPDPYYFSYGGGDRVKYIFPEDKFLELQGRNLNLAHTIKDIQVMISGKPCNITQLTATKLKCVPTDRPAEVTDAEKLREVKVFAGRLEFKIGYIKYVKVDLGGVIGIAAGLSLGAVILIVICVLCYMKRNKKGPFKPKSEFSVRYTATAGEGGDTVDHTQGLLAREGSVNNPYHRVRRGRSSAASSSDRSGLDDETLLLIQDAHLMIERDDLILAEKIGQGHFGSVYHGFRKVPGQKQEDEVAVKTLHREYKINFEYTKTERKKFLKEALIMKEFNHPHILSLVGISIDKDDTPLVVLPFMRHGDLLSFVRNEANTPTVRDLIKFGIQISEGMSYLAEIKFVHRDLAARNCMLADDMTVKVADFGLSRDIYERDYYSSDDKKAKLPVKWMAPESMEKNIYNIKTDVWSYGVVLWELLTRGVTPYPDVDNWDILRYLKSGRRMPQPSFCPDLLYGVMRHCWAANPNDRPTFPDLVEEVSSVIEAMERSQQQHRVSLNVTYVNLPPVPDQPMPEEGYLMPAETSGSSVITTV